MKKIRVGIDIGQDGAYAIFQDGKLVKRERLPKVVDELDMNALMDEVLSYYGEDVTMHVVFEDLHSVYGSSAASNFTFGLNNGLVIGALQAMKIPYTKVQAKRWQKAAWEGIRPVEVPAMEKKKGQPATQKRDSKGNLKYKIDTKATSLIAANRLFPGDKFLPTERSKVAHNGIVDAVLIGWYCDKNF